MIKSPTDFFAPTIPMPPPFAYSALALCTILLVGCAPKGGTLASSSPIPTAQTTKDNDVASTAEVELGLYLESYSSRQFTVLAHRGFARIFPENTLVAIEGAFRAKAAAVEVDVMMTKDGVPVLMHDLTVERTTEGRGAVKDLTFQEIRKLDACHKFGDGSQSCKVPTLAEAINAAEGKGTLVLDIGLKRYAELQTIAAVVDSLDARRRVLITSANAGILRGMRSHAPHLSLGTLEERYPAERLRDLGSKMWLVNKRTVLEDRSVLSKAEEAGVRVLVHTALDVEEARELYRAGVRWIISDVPLREEQMKH